MVRQCVIACGACVFLTPLGGCEEQPRAGAHTASAAQATSTRSSTAATAADTGRTGESAPDTSRGRWSLEWAQLRSSPSDGQKSINDASDLQRVLRDLPHSDDGFVILTEHTGRFMQAASAGSNLLVEFHDAVAGRRARKEGNLSPDDALAAFRSFMEGKHDFPDRQGWIRIGVDGEPIER